MSKIVCFLCTEKNLSLYVLVTNLDFVRSSPNTPHVKLCDFGVSRAVDDEKLRTFVGEQVEGTILYMAPEMIGAKVFSQKCDVYSFGVCVWEMLSRTTPFSGPEYEKMSRFQFDEAKAAGALPGDVPSSCTPRARALIEGCLAVRYTYIFLLFLQIEKNHIDIDKRCSILLLF